MRTLFIVFLLSVTFLAYAQPGSNPGGGTKPGVPLGGIELLLGGGALIGLRKLMKLKRSK